MMEAESEADSPFSHSHPDEQNQMSISNADRLTNNSTAMTVSDYHCKEQAVHALILRGPFKCYIVQ